MLQFLSYIRKPFISYSDTGVKFIASNLVKVSKWFAKLFIYLRKPV